jgi:hypothetical protein
MMIASELLSLLEIFRKLVNSKAELDKKYFDQFIEPAWNLFRKVQEDYKSSFQRYLEFVESDKYDSKVLVEKLRQDSLQSQDFRTELVELVKNIPTAKFKVKEIYLLNFSKSIANYFSVANGFRFDSPNRLDFEDWEVEVFEMQQPSEPGSEKITGFIGDQFISGVVNISRALTTLELSRIGNPDKDQSKLVLERAIEQFQSRYSVVASAYYKLRKELLS